MGPVNSPKEDLSWPDPSVHNGLGTVTGVATSPEGDVYLFVRRKFKFNVKTCALIYNRNIIYPLFLFNQRF